MNTIINWRGKLMVELSRKKREKALENSGKLVFWLLLVFW